MLGEAEWNDEWTWKSKSERTGRRGQGEEVANLECLHVRACAYCACVRERKFCCFFVVRERELRRKRERERERERE